MIGGLGKKIEFLTPSRVDDEAGGASLSWLPGPEMWARVERLTSTRDVAGDRNNRLRRIAASLRYRADILLGQRIIFEDSPYEVVSIESEDDRRLTLICEEVLA
ncbi:phage head closure protein [Hyphococcus lacteus]|uniref:Phage head closure protein n=1 Tax=Hyphococcus lacteus TaxID=3143536 RepID=A0ABV3Z048_9PROT